MAVVLSARNLGWRGQGGLVIEDISFELRPGHMLALLGPNGAGKSTLLRCLSGYYQPSQGQALLNGQANPEAGLRARQLAYLPQKAPLLMPMTVRQAIMLGRRPYLGFKPSAHDLQAVEQAMVRLQLSHLAERRAHLISAGEYQRMLLARVLAQQTPILLLDEPLNNLDLARQLDLLHMLKGMAENEGKTMVISMHDLNMARRFCGQSLLLLEGRCLACGPSVQVLTTPNLSRAFKVNIKHITTLDGIDSYYCA